ncbi:hypothetical protein EDB85DRAFT_1992705 [Lactarius pseudohatsudake]|nr:hypothetical protein EDB85DRAFT_1992705 [Lactarius pseudohatsudake]
MLAGGDAVVTNSLKITLDTSLWRNASPPASSYSESTIQLPLELLQKIFLFLADLCLPPRGFSPFPYPSQPVWIAITYVCRYWRSAALGLYELWSSITPGLSLSWSRSMIERTAQLPMRIDMRIRPCFADGLEALAASKLLLASPGIRTLRLSGYRADILKIVDHLCSPSSLENLDLWVMAYASDYVDLPVALFGGKTPHFRHLKFETTTRVRAPPWLLAGITHFTTSAVFSLHEFFGVLQEMQQLEVLRLVTIFGPWRVTGPPEQVPLRRVALPRLSHLFFRGNNPSDFVVLSSRIDAPPTLRRHLSWRVEAVSSWGQWATMFAATQAFVPGDSALGINDGGLRVAHVVGGYERGSFEMWSRTYSESASTTAREDALFLFHFDWSPSVPDLWSEDGLNAYPCPSFLLASLCVHLRTAPIEDLTIAHETAIEGTGAVGKPVTDTPDAPDVAAQWRALLAALPSVQTLRLRGGNPACVSVLSTLSASADPLLPHLQRVFIFHSAVHSTAAARQNGISVAGAGSSVATTLASRKFVPVDVGAELVEAVNGRSGLEVVLAGCEVSREALDALQKRARVHVGHERVYI